jgi:hypothetical protein
MLADLALVEQDGLGGIDAGRAGRSTRDRVVLQGGVTEMRV